VSRRSHSPSEPPPSSRIPGASGGNGPYVIGIVAFGALTVALLLYWKQCGSAPPPETPPLVAATGPQTQVEPPAVSPPPPPEPETTAAPSADATSKGTSGPAQPGMCEACGKGVSNSAVEAKVKGQAGLAKGCYDRALRTEDVSGKLMVSVSVGADGRVCSSSIVSDTVGSGTISNCVLSKFRGMTFPRPDQGCVVINIPIEFKTK
jgi:hypothetical protein